jgi:hypothetical protein
MLWNQYHSSSTAGCWIIPRQVQPEGNTARRSAAPGRPSPSEHVGPLLIEVAERALGFRAAGHPLRRPGQPARAAGWHPGQDLAVPAWGERSGRLAANGARPAGPCPLPTGNGAVIEVDRTVNTSGLVSLVGQQADVGLPLAGQRGHLAHGRAADGHLRARWDAAHPGQPEDCCRSCPGTEGGSGARYGATWPPDHLGMTLRPPTPPISVLYLRFAVRSS